MQHPVQPAHGASTSTGLAPHVAGGLSYVLGVLSGVLFLVLEKDNAFVRFHAAQSVVVSAALFVAGIAFNVLGAVVGTLPGIGWVLGLAVGAVSLAVAFGGFALWVVMIVKAFTGSVLEVPVAAGYARRLAAAVRV